MFLGIWSPSAEFSKAWGAHVQSVLNQGARANVYFQRKKYEGWLNHLTLNIVSVFYFLMLGCSCPIVISIGKKKWLDIANLPVVFPSEKQSSVLRL